MLGEKYRELGRGNGSLGNVDWCIGCLDCCIEIVSLCLYHYGRVRGKGGCFGKDLLVSAQMPCADRRRWDVVVILIMYRC